MRKVLLLSALLGLVVVFGAFGSGAQNAPSKQSAPYTMNLLYPGDPSPNMAANIAAGPFKDALANELGITLKVNYAPWNNYWNKIDLMLASGEKFDWFWTGAGSVPGHVARKQALELNDLLKKYGPDILKNIPADNMKQFMFGGKIYAIPSQASSSAEKFNTVLARTDILDQVGVKNIETYDQLLDACAKVKAKFPEMGIFAEVPWAAILREVAPGWYVNWDFPYMIWNENEKTPKVYSFIDQKDILMKLNKLTYALLEKGYISDEVLANPIGHVARFQSGNYVFMSGAVSRPMEMAAAVQKNDPKAYMREFMLNSKTTHYRFGASNEAILIPFTNKSPEKAIQMLNWMYKTQDNYEMALFGVKGKDFTIDAKGILNQINPDPVFYEWMFRNNNYMRYPDNMSPEAIADFKAWDNGAVLSKTFGFSFDPTPIKAELGRLGTVAPTHMSPIIMGFVDLSKGDTYAVAQKKLKDAGIDAFIAEYNKQFAAWAATK